MVNEDKIKLDNLQKALKDPHTVHMAMLRGEIAKPSCRDILHVYPELEREKLYRDQQSALSSRARLNIMIKMVHQIIEAKGTPDFTAIDMEYYDEKLHGALIQLLEEKC